MEQVSFSKNLTYYQKDFLAELPPHCVALSNMCAFNCQGPHCNPTHVERAETMKDKAVAILLYILADPNELSRTVLAVDGRRIVVDFIKSLEPDDILRLTSPT
jgi:hypothetical protein